MGVTQMNTLLLLSGGMDSTLCLHQNKNEIKLCVGFDYGQNHIIELDYAEKIAKFYEKQFLRIKLPKIELVDDVVFAGRNLVLLANAISVALSFKLKNVMIGVNKTDTMRFPDCSEKFVTSMNVLGLIYGISVVAPLTNTTKKQIVEISHELPETWTCYTPINNRPCGKCLACETLR